jgi:hypothetical protein
MTIYGVHTYAWGHFGETELLSQQRSEVERHARCRSEDWPYGLLVVTARELDRAGSLRVLSEWRDGTRVDSLGDGPGRWRKTREVT